MVHVTALFSGGLALFFIKLSMDVIRLRKRHQISLGSGGLEELDRAIRAQANFSEYVPLALVLMGALEINGAPVVLVTLLGTLLFAGQYLHASGLGNSKGGQQRSIYGMKWTFFALALMALSNVGWTAYQVIESARFAGSMFVR